MSEADDIRRRVEEVRSRIAEACRRAGRSDDEVTLVAVTKTFSAETVMEAVAAGLLDFGENRVQELTQKAHELEMLGARPSVRWHMIGHLQRNKARDVVEVAACFHGLDSLRLAVELDKRASVGERVLPCLVQVNTSGEESKAGIHPDGVRSLVDGIRELERIDLRGLMTIAAPAENPEEVRHEFRALRQIRDSLVAEDSHLSLEYLSMGMSGDYEVAIEEGATHVRIGSAIFGGRSA